MHKLILDPAGDHWLEPVPTLTIGTRRPRCQLLQAFRSQLRLESINGEPTVFLGEHSDLELGRFTEDGWTPTQVLSPLETRFLADRGYPHPHPPGEPARNLRTDLHTHFAGCVGGADLVRIGADHGVVFPAVLLREAGIDAGNDIELSRAPDDVRRRLARALSLPVDRPCTHLDMNRVYRLRRPLTKHRPAFADLCRQIGRDYAAMGVEYAELSLFDILEPACLKVAHHVLPEILADTGVDLRFLAALSRHDDLEWDLDMVDRLRAFAGSQVIVGVDFMGHETNSTRDFLPHLRAVAAFARERRPDFVIRVHAGENPGHPENVRVAVETLIAENVSMRVGHGLYGVDDDMMEVMAERQVTVEFNLDSNFALNNVRDALQVPLARYAAKGVPVVLGTDGYGIYRGDAAAQCRGAWLTGLADPSSVVEAEHAVIEARLAADARMNRPFVVPATSPAARHFTPEVASRLRALRMADEAALRDAITTAGGRLFTPGELDERLLDRPWISFAGAWRKSWARLDDATQAHIAELLDDLVATLAAQNAVLLTGGTMHGVEGCLHQSAARHGATVIGAVVEASPATDLANLDVFCLVGRTLYDKACGLYRLLRERGGTALFIGGGNIVHDEVRVAANLRLRRGFLADVPGASGAAAKRWPRRAFRTAAEALQLLDSTAAVSPTLPGGRLLYTGANPTADVVCVRLSPAAHQRQLLLIRRRNDVGAEAGKWALPGGFIRSSAAAGDLWRGDLESPAEAALRELAEETGLSVAWLLGRLVPIGVFQGDGRDPRDTEARFSRSHAFLLELPAHLAAATVIGLDDAGEARWHRWDQLPPLAFDHRAIVNLAKRRLAARAH